MKITFDANFENFFKSFQKKTKEISEDETAAFLKHISILFLQLVIPKTPVDTGRARAGWYPAAKELGAGTFADVGEGSLKTSLKGKKKFIEIFNRVEYIVLLEYGRSKQAPNGMARVSLDEVKKLVRGFKK